LEASDYIVEEPDEPAEEAPPAPEPFDPDQPMISLNAIASIRT
jgi:hypothetical protein